MEKAIAESFSSEGASVAFTYLSSEEKAQALTEQLSSSGTKAKAYRSDAANFSASNTLIEEVVKDFGKIDVLVNNAGVTRDGLVLRMQESAWDEVQATNLKACFNTTKHISRHFMRQRSGKYY